MLKLVNLSYSIPTKNGRLDILKNINFEFETGKTYAITGQNGSGKSTLAKLIMGIIKPTTGKIYFDGQDITSLSATDRANLKIAFAFQQPVKFKGLTVKDILSVANNKTDNIAECCNYLSTVGLCARDYINRELDSKLSGGELKRIEIATVALRQTKLTIFDEPEAGIDLWSFNNLIDVFQTMSEITKGTTIIISHQEKILEIADEIILMKSGKIQKIGTSEEILKEEVQGKGCCKIKK